MPPCRTVRELTRPLPVSRYYSIRIDPVHYCKLEAVLAEKRKKTKRFDYNGIPEDPALARLRLFRRTVRDDPTRIGKLVQFLKTPWMLRESCHVELAQTIAVLPNLKYIDLPEGMFSDEPNYATLRLEVQARCPKLRKMTYVKGSERSFADLVLPNVWPELEVLELDRLEVDPMILRNVLGSLVRLRALKVTETRSFSDEVMVSADGRPPLPALEELVLKDTPRMTIAGLTKYCAWEQTKATLRVLILKDTGVQTWRLQEILALAPALRTLAFQAKVSVAFPQDENAPLLSSRRLRTLRFEISSTAEAGPYVTPGYYSYLASCVMSGGLPKLRRLFVLDDKFPEKLSGLPAPGAPFAGGQGFRATHGEAPSIRISAASTVPMTPMSPSFKPLLPIGRPNRFSSNNPYAAEAGAPPPKQTLEIFTKQNENDRWNFSRVDSVAAVQEGLTAHRPASSYGLAADVAGQGWNSSGTRRSVMIGNGANGFFTVSGEGDEDGSNAATFQLMKPPPRRFPPPARGNARPQQPASRMPGRQPQWDTPEMAEDDAHGGGFF
ncbi:hypothetical protein DCS_05764 [Drechmeria coniospora]|uniref:F-box domain protein n=1 Tax=Drechmeria coniospora TaxID=98403 RepID=A0A151GNQ2_DRECN|nr:hypothetical protein DCS_05764 [Drechmeria coniospora]KYK58747.1 hypothetical protein DCS_05764 [Drechmeria coniospora]